MAAADVIVLTSHSESFPNVLLEGQCLGLAAVSLDVGATREIIADKESGYVVKPGDRMTFTKKLVELLEDKAKRESMGQMGKNRILNRFSMQIKVDKFVSMVK